MNSTCFISSKFHFLHAQVTQLFILTSAFVPMCVVFPVSLIITPVTPVSTLHFKMFETTNHTEVPSYATKQYLQVLLKCRFDNTINHDFVSFFG